MAKKLSEGLPIVVITVAANSAELKKLHLELKWELLEFKTCLLTTTDDIAVCTWVKVKQVSFSET